MLPDCNVVLDAHMRVRFDAKRLNKANKLQLFVTATTGDILLDPDHACVQTNPAALRSHITREQLLGEEGGQI